MTISNFSINLNLLLKFSQKLTREDIPAIHKKALIKTYANSLYINLTNNMVNELI